MEGAHVVRDDDPQPLRLAEALAEVFDVALHRRGDRVGIDAIRTHSDGSAPPASSEGDHLVEAVDQEVELLCFDHPAQDRAVVAVRD